MGREGEVFEESEGPIEDILGGRKDKMLYTILRGEGRTVSEIYEILL
jgi:hypothetical protein